MRTIPTLIATATGTTVSTLGLTIARPDHHTPNRPSSSYPKRASLSRDMIAVAAPSNSPNFTPVAPFDPRLPAFERENGRWPASGPRSLRNPSRPASAVPRNSPHTGMEQQQIPHKSDGGPIATDTKDTMPRAWLRRLSSSVSSSREPGSYTPSSRPASAVVSPSSGSVALSQSHGSTAPMLHDPSLSSASPFQPPHVPNKLVKRPPSVRRSQDSFSALSSSPGSRLPMPVLRRPATSYQRAVLLDQRLHEVSAQPDDRIPIPADHEARDDLWRQYFVPHVHVDIPPTLRRRSQTFSSIPNPIKRVYPDRKYTPVLISARETVQPAVTQVDSGMDNGDDAPDNEWVSTNVHADDVPANASAPSSPWYPQSAQFENSHSPPRRSFSIGDLLSPGPHPLWRRPSSRRSKSSTTSRVSERGRPRVASVPLVLMGGRLSTAASSSRPPSSEHDVHDTGFSSKRSTYSSPIDASTEQRLSANNIEFRLGFEDAASSPLAIRNAYRPPTAPIAYSRTPSPRDLPRPSSAHYRFPHSLSTRNSATHSELTSASGSESEQRSTGDNSFEYQSDTVYDSIPTRRTRSGSGRRGPHIETIFNESPPSFVADREVKLRDLLQNGQFPGSDHNARYRHSTIDEEESVVSTPVRSIRNRSAANTPSARSATANIFASSPPTMKITPDLGDLDWDSPPEDDHEDDGDETHSLPRSTGGTPIVRSKPLKTLSFGLGPALRFGHLAPTATPKRQAGGGSGAGAGGSFMDKANLFDWAEQQPSPSHLTDSPPRPRTVHGKKDQDSRGSRPVGRRGPSGMHARSHSVPVVPDVDGKRSTVVANKFGTWGVGSKAVTEDWNEDFDFDDDDDNDDENSKSNNNGDRQGQGQGQRHDRTMYDEKRIDSGHEMFVPQSIREQQANVVANIGLLREWGLLIEELKELRIRAVSLGMLTGPYAQAWREVDAMIELADQETEEETLAPPRSPPSSPGFDSDAFDEPPLQSRQTSFQLPEPVSPLSGNHASTHHERAPVSDETNPQNESASSSSPPPVRPSPTRQRNDSQSIARSVIAALQSRRTPPNDASALPAIPPTKKVPFDTATLRHIVPYVNGLSRKVKDGLREEEGLYLSPRRAHPETDHASASPRSKRGTPSAGPSHPRRGSDGDERMLRSSHDVFYNLSQRTPPDSITQPLSNSSPASPL